MNTITDTEDFLKSLNEYFKEDMQIDKFVSKF